MYHYVAGKADWGSFGLPLEGRAGSATRIGGLVREDAPRCGLDERIADVAERVGEEWQICVVTNVEGVVLGVLLQDALRSGATVRAEDAMTPGPRTIRPSARQEAIAKRLQDEGVAQFVVTHSDGKLVGVLRRDDLATVMARR